MNISFKYFYRKIEEEYHHLSLWYFVSFIFGIVCFFQNVSEFSFPSSLAVVIPLFILAIYLRNKNLLLFFATACCLSFFVGFFVNSFQTSLVETKPIEKMIIADVTGEVISIKPSLRGMQLLLVM